jgi:hypothetical protein
MKRTILFAALIITSAHAATITIMSTTGIASATAARDAWLASNFGAGATIQNLENFEGFGYGPYTTLAAGPGTFSVMAGSLPSYSNGTRKNELLVLNSSDTPFSGRFNTTPGGHNWLDSNDITKLQLTTSLSTVFFFITDVNDIDGALRIQTADGSSASNFAPVGADGNLYFVGITSSGPIGSIQWINNSQNDGFGLDDFGTVKYNTSVPEPANSLAAGTGLLLLATILRLRVGQVGNLRRIGNPPVAQEASAPLRMQVRSSFASSDASPLTLLSLDASVVSSEVVALQST